MKLIKYICMELLLCLLFCACSDTNVGNPSFSEDEMPYIYMEWASSYVYKLGDVIKFNPQVSPTQGTSCQWLIDGKVVSEKPSIEYKIEMEEDFTLRFEVERYGVKNFRTAQVTIQKDFKPKDYEKIAMGVLSINGAASSVQWDYITHLMYSSLVVSDEQGTLKLPDASALANLKTIVSLAHNKGIYVIVDISGSINFPIGTGVYNETAFNMAAIDPAKRTKLIGEIKSFVEEYDLDGVNIYMNNLSNDAGKLQNPDELVAFMNELGEALPAEGIEPRNCYFLTASVPMAWNNSEFYYLGRVPRLDWVNLMLFGATNLSPSHLAPDWQVDDNINRFTTAAGIPASKLLVGIGAFGVQYDIPPGTTPTWGNIDQFLSYPTYSDIVKLDASAPGKDMLPIASGLYYTGVSAESNSVNSKAAIVKNNGVQGMFIWCMDYDTQNAANSLTQTIFKQMNPAD